MSVIPWYWLMACATVMLVCVYGLEALVSEGPERERAFRIVVGVVTGFFVISKFM